MAAAEERKRELEERSLKLREEAERKRQLAEARLKALEDQRGGEVREQQVGCAVV